MKCRLQEAAIDKSNSSDKYLNDYKKKPLAASALQIRAQDIERKQGRQLRPPLFHGNDMLI